MVIQKDDNEQDDGNQGGIWAQIGVDIPSSNAFSTAEMEDTANSAILFKYRYNMPVGGFETGFYNGSATIHSGISNDNHSFSSCPAGFYGIRL